MKKFSIIFCMLILFFHGTAFANVRAPFRLKGGVSGVPFYKSNTFKNVSLLQENLNIVFPQMNVDDFPETKAKINAHYTFINNSEETIEVPVNFLALKLSDTAISLNNEGLIKFSSTHDFKLTNELAEKIYNVVKSEIHKEQDKQIRKFISSYLQITPAVLIKSQLFLDIKKLITAKLNNIVFNQISFKLKLKPGKNDLIISYKQEMIIDEGKTGYLKEFYYSKGIFGIAYLLYPAKTWHFSEKFIFNLNIELPDFVERRFFIRFYQKALWRSNVKLATEYDKEKRKIFLLGRFKKFPSEMLMFYFKRKE